MAVREHPILIRDIDHVVLRVIDLEKMLSFYCGVLGCSLERRQDDLGLIQLRAGNSLIDLVPITGKLGSAGGAAPGTEGRNMDYFSPAYPRIRGAKYLRLLGKLWCRLW